MKIHELKTWPNMFEALSSGDKKCEVRKNDRGFSVGDVLKLMEFRPCPDCNGSSRVWDNGDMTSCRCASPHGTYTGEVLWMTVTHILDGSQWGLRDGYVVMSVEEVDEDVAVDGEAETKRGLDGLE